MKILKSLLFIFSIMLIPFILISCNNKVNKSQNYKYGAVFTSINKEKSTITTYSEEGTQLYSKDINIGGLTLASFFKLGVMNNENLYYACPISKGKPNDYIMQLNTKTLDAKKIKSEDYISPTFFCVDNTFSYSGSSTLTTTYLSKTNLNTEDILNSIELPGQGILAIDNNTTLYVISIIHDENQINKPFGRLYLINKSDLSISKELDLPELSFATDAKIVNDTMYILINRDGDDNLSNKLLQLNLLDFSINTLQLPFDNLYQLYSVNNDLYVIEASYHLDKTQNRIAKINLTNMNIDVFTADNQHISSTIYEDKFISSDSKFIYIYDISNFKLLTKFPIETPKDMTFVSLYSK